MGRSKYACRNYNRILLPIEEGKILTCGTTAFSGAKSCQVRKIQDLSDFTSLSGEEFVPTNPVAFSTATFSDRRLFSGTMISNDPESNAFAISSAKIAKDEKGGLVLNAMVSTLLDPKFLNKAKFVASFSSGDYVYFLFQEIDYTNTPSTPDKQVVSRIARVCKADNGWEMTKRMDRPDFSLWRTFVKARIMCENKVEDQTFGEQTFSYNRIGHGILDGNRMLYAAFSQGDTSASGSVVCRYNLDDIDKNFDTGRYIELDGSIYPVKARTAPTCGSLSVLQIEEYYKLHLTENAVKSEVAPLFLQAGPQFTQLLLDNNVQNSTEPVLFIGTDKGQVLKVTWINKQPILIESLQVAVGNMDSNLTVNFLAFEKKNDPNYLLVGTGTSVAKVVISRCLRLNLSKNCCFASRDPYCGWCPARGACTSKPDCSSEWIQSLNGKPDEKCEGTPSSETTMKPKTNPPTEPPLTIPDKPITDPPGPPTSPPNNVTPDPHKSVITRGPDVRNTTSAGDGSNPDSNIDQQAMLEDEDSWRTVAIVMAILCGIFVLISLLLALNMARRWCSPEEKSPAKQGNNNLQHSYNPLSSTGPKSEDFSDRIAVYDSIRTNNV